MRRQRLRAVCGADFSDDMEIRITEQAALAALSLILGAAMGLVYDLFKAFRLRVRRKGFTAFSDMLYCALAALILFAFGMGPGGGQLRLYMVIAVCVGAAVYGFLASRTVLAVFSRFADAAARAWHVMWRPVKRALQKMKKILKNIKNIFQKFSGWFTITSKYRQKTAHTGANRGSDDVEVQKGRYIY